ncbi:putative secreted RxLR effector protein [Phytophthora cinnamomi]|uniref:putative secreted RxLR effector protein n=1 Tax=Phytophthora cinnamomi TaxID=4785 RepID=UPI002A28B060|nr:putative secreted RxLR effector protein [Phytophthora cinnamomi]KAJ8533482.1 hypothetical protein ON010_g13772 [Phytophthora cinnamomi]
MRLSYVLVVAVASYSAIGEVSAFEAPAKLSLQNNERGEARFLRTNKKTDLSTTNDGEERVTMNFEGKFHNREETKDLLKFWLKNGESEDDVAAKLGLASLPLATRKQHENWKALARYNTILFKNKRFKIGSAYFNKKQTETQVWQWALGNWSEEDVMKMLGLSKLSGDKLKAHKNYWAFEEFLVSEKKVADLRAKHAATVKTA